MPTQGDPQLINAFIAVLFLTLIGVTLLVMGSFWLVGWAADRFGWFTEEPPATATRPHRRPMSPQAHATRPPRQPRELPEESQGPPWAPDEATSPHAQPQAPTTLATASSPPGPVSVAEATTHAATLPQPDVALERQRWWPQIADSALAVMIVGESQSGKSTTARALLAWRARTDRIVIIDPHEKFNDWGSLQEVVLGRDRNLDQAAMAFEVLHVEFERRFKRAERVGANLSIFIDETPAIISYAPEVADYLAQWLLEGAKAGFRVVFLTQEPGVDALGIKGKGKVRLSTRKVLLGAFAADAPGVLAWPAAIEVTGTVKSIDASALPEMAMQAAAIDPAVAWLTPTELTAEPPEPVRDGAELRVLPPLGRTGSGGSTLVRAGTDAVRAGSAGWSDDELLAELVRRGVSGNRIHELLGGTRATVLDKVRELRDQAS